MYKWRSPLSFGTEAGKTFKHCEDSEFKLWRFEFSGGCPVNHNYNGQPFMCSYGSLTPERWNKGTAITQLFGAILQEDFKNVKHA